MHDKIDFSRLERIEPRKGSWETVCARLDSSNQKKFIKFIQARSLYALAASLIVVSFLTVFTVYNYLDSEDILMTNVASDELVSWYGNLGETSDDELENLDTYKSISYLLQETK
ncbi:conserved domain protein [Fibrobacter succinogenes subsp. succinogenes S85]|jgi:hypothetical protein|uniref:Conserved domain protein n=2 Tax=Fibrobacter succinogenes TaxID=833 RepID=C9RQ96_FIBSS|nr:MULTISPECIES: hypothetical protein [Fibrobacter]ACX74773.1 hypothetical protein Fisuc_1170 [Fibrobacter succinogenes subsp. succinogenes S85]ADL26143.1 conserved domain protein [Fibrobacter succinogenes subsp. succinogenes S85]OWV21732.1 hypothetical protein B7982_11540 [Fibrobacter sp. UWB2]PWJ34669.1 hypothetical protein IE02_2206 [Fibrobacter succinogenes subsp. elongatus]SUQ24792.1 hypothetical protein SAMN05661053_2206 [Fibrobacter succinogenes]